MPLRRGKKSLAQTPAPPKERIKGSKKNPKGSAASDKSASTIKLSESIIEALQGKLAKFKEENPSKKNITLNDLKAVYRRGAGAYSSSHRPTISGGKPNTRNAWAMARVNKFLKKAAGEQVKKAYVQDDDLLKFHLGGDMSKHLAPNGKPSNLSHEQWHLVRTPEFKAWFGFWEENSLIENFLSGRGFVMGDRMAFSISNSKILNPIISLIPVDVMDNFGGEEGAVQVILHNKSMFVDVFTLAKRNSFIVAFMNEAIIFITITRAKLSNTKPTSSNAEIFSALNTLQNNLIFIVNSFAFSSKFSAFHKVSPFAVVRAKFFIGGSNPTFDAIRHNDLLSDKDKEYYTTLQSNSLNASKVVDENGEPLVVYHGTVSNFNTFKYGEFGFHFGTLEQAQKRISRFRLLNIYYRIIPCFINLKNPITLKDLFTWQPHLIIQELLNLKLLTAAEAKNLNGKQRSIIIATLLKKNVDGYMYLNLHEGDGYSYSVFEPTQIKLADGTNTTFDPSNPDIRYAKGGEITSETTAAFNRKMKRELPSIKRQVIYDGYSGEEIDKKVNENIAYKYMQYVTTKLGMKFGEIEFENKSKEPTNHFQLVCSVWDDKNDYILWATFVYVNDNHQVDESQTNMQLLNLNYEHVKTIHEEPPYFEQGGDILIQDTVARMDNLHLADAAFYKEGGLTDTEKTERYKKWKSLVNMSKGELKRFYDSEEGKVAGLTPSQAKAAGIDSGRESARWIMKMKDTPVSKWTPEMWRWAGKQISFISRMSGVKGGLYDDKGRKTRKHLSLLIWGHNPEKYGKGGKVNKPIDEFIFTPENTHESINVLGNLEIDPLIGVFNDGGTLNSKTYTMDIQKFNSLPHIDTLKVGDTILLKEAAITNKGAQSGERFIKAQVERFDQLGKVNMAVLKVIKSVGDKPLSALHIRRPINNIMKLGRALTEFVVPEIKNFKHGGEIDPDSAKVKEYFAHGSGNVGGVLVGKRHSEGGIKAVNKSTGQPLEMEGGEVVITRGAVSNPKKYNFDGKEMTTREILSKLNVDGGGVSFADGGDIPEKINCGCASYDFGGTTMSVKDFVNMSEQEYQQLRLEKGIEKERIDHFSTLSKLNAGAITVEQALREIADKEMRIDPKYPFGE